MPIIGRIIFIAAALMGISGCSVENKTQIAMKTLYQDTAGPAAPSTPTRPFPALTGALNARFPAGSGLNGLRSYIGSLDGSCESLNSGHSLACTLIESSSFCIRNSISVVATIDNAEKITGIEAWHVIEGC